MTLGPQLWVAKPHNVASNGPRRDRISPVTYRGVVGRHTKPRGGLWTSPLRDDGIGGWVEWVRSEQMPWLGPAYLLYPEKDVRVYVVDSYEDLEQLAQTYPIRDSILNEDWIDFEKLGEDYDAFHLTNEGQWRTRLTYPLSLYGWDCETVFWYRWKFTKVEPYSLPRQKEEAT